MANEFLRHFGKKVSDFNYKEESYLGKNNYENFLDAIKKGGKIAR